MFNIVSITTASGNNTSILLGGPAGKELIGPHGPLGPEGSSYVLAFPGLGYIKFDDVGGKVRGAGSWSLKVSGSSTNWFYEGGGQANVAVDGSGGYTISGGANTITGKLTPF